MASPDKPCQAEVALHPTVYQQGVASASTTLMLLKQYQLPSDSRLLRQIGLPPHPTSRSAKELYPCPYTLGHESWKHQGRETHPMV